MNLISERTKAEAAQIRVMNLDTVKTLIEEQLLALPAEYLLSYLYGINLCSGFFFFSPCISYARGVEARGMADLFAW